MRPFFRNSKRMDWPVSSSVHDAIVFLRLDWTVCQVPDAIEPWVCPIGGISKIFKARDWIGRSYTGIEKTFSSWEGSQSFVIFITSQPQPTSPWWMGFRLRTELSSYRYTSALTDEVKPQAVVDARQGTHPPASPKEWIWTPKKSPIRGMREAWHGKTILLSLIDSQRILEDITIRQSPSSSNPRSIKQKRRFTRAFIF